MTKSINDFNEDEKFQIVTSILEDITDKFWVVCERDRKVCIIGHNPDEMVSALLENLSSKMIYPPKRQYLNDRFNEIGWEHYTWN
tara:strand:- start:121 stop:375 length:255 start_codon:yes stop_codon:yes gene_type:complete